MRIFGAIVQAFVRSMLDRGHDLTPRWGAGTELVRDDTFRPAPLLSQQSGQQPSGGFSIAAGLDDLVEQVAILVDGAPQPVLLAAYRHGHFVQMPDIARARRFPPQPAGIIRSELLCPAADRFIGNDDVSLPAASLRPDVGSAEIEKTARAHGQSQQVENDGACS